MTWMGHSECREEILDVEETGGPKGGGGRDKDIMDTQAVPMIQMSPEAITSHQSF